MKYEISDGIVFDIKNCHLTFNDSEYDTSQKIRESFIASRKDDFNEKNKVIHTISLNPTYRCDGNCSYCYNIAENNREENDLTFNDFEKAINELKTRGYEIDLETLRLYGGEPLLVKNLSKLIIQIKKKYKFDTLYISSGLLFNDKKFELAKIELMNLIKNGIEFTIGISVDFGLLDKQFTRLSNKTEITRQLLLDRCSMLENIGVRIVYATIVSKNTDIDLLKKHITDHYNTKSNKFNLDKMDTNQDRAFAYRISISNHNTLYPSIEKVQSLYDMYVELYETLPITSNLYPYTDVIYSPDIIQLDPDNFLFLLTHTYCGVYTDMIAIFPGGELGSCHMTPCDRNLKPTKEQYDYFFNNEKCNSCDFFGICRGLCVNRNLQAPAAMDSYCLWSQLSFKLSLKRLYLLNKNNFKEYITNKAC